MPDDYYALLLREKAVASILREFQELLNSMRERGAEPENIDIALKQILAARGAGE